MKKILTTEFFSQFSIDGVIFIETSSTIRRQILRYIEMGPYCWISVLPSFQQIGEAVFAVIFPGVEF